ncbi:MAG: hypothetical protein RPT95_00010 [Candidatus Sedimenticola sp. (ex Thyasira tokunagai)]
MRRQRDNQSNFSMVTTKHKPKRGKDKNPHGIIGDFIRVVMTIAFLYLIVVSHELLGITGILYVSLLFLAALLGPFLYQLVKALRRKSKASVEKKPRTVES